MLTGFSQPFLERDKEIRFPPLITYPDSILRLFPKAYRAKYGVDPK